MELTDHITLPVSALKSEATRVFDALAEGRTVYVSKQGDIVAAFRPDVPVEVAAAYVLPQVTTAELTSRAMQQAAPTKAVKDAVVGLPSLVTRDHKVYGMLVAAELPAASIGDDPDLDTAEARSEAMSGFLEAHPNAPIEDIAAYREQLDAHTAAASTAEHAGEGTITTVDVNDDEIDLILAQWRQRGSVVEQAVEVLLLNRSEPLARYAQDQVNVRELPGDGLAGTSVTLRKAAEILGTDPVGARMMYVNALTAYRDRGLMWRLGDLTRREGYVPEATKWYDLALRPGPTERPQAAPTARASVSRVMRSPKARANDIHKLRGIGPKYAEILEKIGVDSIKELRRRNPASLTQMIAERHGKTVGISEKQVAAWIKEAKSYPVEISHRRSGRPAAVARRPARRARRTQAR